MHLITIKITSSNCFSPTNSSNLQDSSFTVINDESSHLRGWNQQMIIKIRTETINLLVVNYEISLELVSLSYFF